MQISIVKKHFKSRSGGLLQLPTSKFADPKLSLCVLYKLYMYEIH